MSTGIGEGEFRVSCFATRKSTFVESIMAFVIQGRILTAVDGGKVILSISIQDFGSAMVEETSPMIVVLSKMLIQFVFALVATLASNDGAKIVAVIGMYLDGMTR